MTILLYVSAFLAFAIGVAHSVLGERYILVRLFKRTDIPKLFGGTEFTTRTLRFAWHLTTVAWWGFAVILVQLAQGSISASSIASVIGITFLCTAVLTFTISRAKHLAWLVFLFIGIVALYASLN